MQHMHTRLEQMDYAGQIGYPAIAKAQRLSAERLGARGDFPQQPQRPLEVQIRERTEGARQHAQGRQKTCQKRDPHSIITGAVRSSLPRRVSSSNPAVGDLSTCRSRSTSPLPPRARSTSPLPPRHDDRGSPMERTFADIGQVRNPKLLLQTFQFEISSCVLW